MPDALLSELNHRLPKRLDEKFRDLLVKLEYDESWKRAQLIFQRYANATLVLLDETPAPKNVRMLSVVAPIVTQRPANFQYEVATISAYSRVVH
jgi:hypothetical protein